MLTLGAAALVATAASAAYAQASGGSTPSSWNYEIKDGKRVPKAERKVNADGSWREEIRQGDLRHGQGKDRRRANIRKAAAATEAQALG